MSRCVVGVGFVPTESYQNLNNLIKQGDELTHAVLQQVLHYDPATGVFTWLVKPCRSVSIGDVAGHTVSKGRVQITIAGRSYYAHRLAWLYTHGYWPAAQIDHRDLDGGNNRRKNIREATNTQNQANTGRRENNTSGFKGVGWHKLSGKWRARIMLNGKRTCLGYFATPELAHAAYCAAADSAHGEFANHG